MAETDPINPKIKTTSLEDSPAYKQQMATQEAQEEALGGRASHPSEFQPMARGPQGAGSAALGAPQARGAIATPVLKPKSIFDVSTDEKQAAAQLDQLRSHISGVITQTNGNVPVLNELLESALENPAFVKLAASQGFDTKKAAKFISVLLEAVETVTAK